MVNDSDKGIFSPLSFERFWANSMEAAAGNSDPSYIVLLTPTDQ